MKYASEPRIAVRGGRDEIKQAALYFRFVVPLFSADELITSDQPFMLTKSALAYVERPLLEELLPPELDTREHSEYRLALSEKRKGGYLKPKVDAYEEALEAVGCQISGDFVAADDCPLAANGEPSITLANLWLVDTSAMPWDKLMELRRDEVAIQKLRNLRLFIGSEYDGKDLDFVRDDLEMRIERYLQTVKDWELETKYGALSMIFASNTTWASATGLAAALALGGPVASVLTPAAIAGLSCELGKAVLEVRRRRREYQKFQNTDPIAYIVESRKSLDTEGGECSSGDD